jgi:hypothetical protein
VADLLIHFLNVGANLCQSLHLFFSSGIYFLFNAQGVSLKTFQKFLSGVIILSIDFLLFCYLVIYNTKLSSRKCRLNNGSVNFSLIKADKLIFQIVNFAADFS